MPRYLIQRTFDVSESEMPAVSRRSRELTEGEFSEIDWEHSHVIVDETGLVRTFCVYSAPSEALVREHGARLGMHKIDFVDEIAADVTPADFPPV